MKQSGPSQHITKTVELHLLGIGARLTTGRRLIVEQLAAANGPRTPSDLHAGLGDRLPLSSLYRGLAALEEAGVLSRHAGLDGHNRYEIAERFVGHHHHLVCLGCGEMVDVELDAGAEKALGTVAFEAARDAGYRLSGHGLEIEGLCNSCR